MDKSELVEVLRKLDERLPSSVDVILIGGAAMILHFGATRATRDIDVVVTIMDHVSRFRPDWAGKIRYFLQEQGWEIA